MRDYSPADRSGILYSDGGNLSAVLNALRTDSPDDYASILRALRAVLPWFDDFMLEEEGAKGVLLRWKMTGRGEYMFGPGQLSDGSLRIMSLITLLLLPIDRMPNVIVLDEPELGLHPSAEEVIAGLIRNASRSCQVIISTQSAGFIDHFSADDIIVVECENGESSFKRQSQEDIKNWLQRYTLSQIWSKNLIGGRP